MLLKNLNKRIFIGLIGIVVLTMAIANPVMAAVPATFSEEAQKNALINARNRVLYRIIADCYGDMSENITVDSGYLTWADVFGNSGNGKHDIPYYLFDNVDIRSSKKLSCSEIMGGWDKLIGDSNFPGIGYHSGDVPVVDSNGNFGSRDDAVTFLEKIGFTPTSESAEEVDGYRCVSYRGSTVNGRVYDTDRLCARSKDGDADQIDLTSAFRILDYDSSDLGSGNMETIIYKIKTLDYSDGILTLPKVGYDLWYRPDGAAGDSAFHRSSSENFNMCTNTFVPVFVWSDPSGVTRTVCYSYGFAGWSTGRVKVSNITTMTFRDLARVLGTAILTAKETDPSNFPSDTLDVNGANITPAQATDLEKGSFEDYMRYFMGNDYETFSTELTETEKYMLYWSGLKEVVTASGGATNGNVWYWLVGTSFETDYNLSCVSDCKITTLVGGEMKVLDAVDGDHPTVLDLLNGIDYDSEDFGEVEDPERDVYDDLTDPNSNNTDDIKCTGAGGMSWLVCEALEWMQDAVEGIYNDYVEPNLRLQPQLFSEDIDGGRSETYEAWGYFRRFANICFVIFLLAVIFSQLTGVGIDNYGIKKILPKLIITAILVNLSFVICEIGVDLSNILGTSLKNMFSSLITGSITAFNGVNTGSGLAAVGILAGTGAAALTITALFTNPAGLLTLLISAIGVMISIFFLFILLAMREAAVVILVVIAPVAFVLYILPNTKKLFDKWLKFFEAMLLVYPICGLLVGGGDYVSRLLLKVNGASEFAMFTAMIVGIVPIFFIPMALKGAFAAMGKVGATLSGFGARVSGSATKKLKGSELNKNLQERGAERRTRIMAGVDRKGNEKNVGTLGRFMRGGKRNMARAKTRYLKDREARGIEDNLMEGGFATGLAGVDEKINKRRDEDAEAMLAYGRASYIGDDDKEVFVNPGDVESVGKYHEAALKEYHEAGTDSKKQAEALSKIKAAQKLLSKTDGGRAKVQNNLESAIAGGYAGGTNAAALHLQSNFGDVYKSKNRGANNLINDLASGKGIDEISKSIGNGDYEIAGADKYDQMSLVGADALALKNMSNAVNRISGKVLDENASDEEKKKFEEEQKKLEQVRGTAIKAIQMYDAGRLSIKPETLGYIEDIAGVKAQATVSVNGTTTTGDTSGISTGGNGSNGGGGTGGGGSGNGGGNGNRSSGNGATQVPGYRGAPLPSMGDKSKPSKTQTPGYEGSPLPLIGDTRNQEKIQRVMRKNLSSNNGGELNINHNGNEKIELSAREREIKAKKDAESIGLYYDGNSANWNKKN